MSAARPLALGLGFALVGAAASGCGANEECAALEQLKQVRQRRLARAQHQAKLLPQLEETAKRQQARATAEKAKLGLDLSEAQIEAKLRVREAAIQGSVVVKSQRERPIPDSEQTETQTVWVVRFPADGLDAAFARVQEFAAIPPLLELLTLAEDAEPGWWRLQLGRVVIDEADLDKVQPSKSPPLPGLDEVPSAWGWCGAGKLRDEIRALDAQLEAARPQAERFTVVLPLSSSWQGVARRSEKALLDNSRARARIGELIAYASKAKLPLRAIGSADELVILELHQGPRTEAKLNAALPPGVLASMRKLSGPKHLLRVSFPVQPHPKDGKNSAFGLPPPDKLREAFDHAHQHDTPNP